MNYLEWSKRTYGSHHCTSLFTSIGFDLTLTSIFLPLISQGEIRIYSEDPFVGLQNLQNENAVTFLKATPSHLRILKPMSNVKTLVAGGEQLTTAMALKWNHARVFNEYGPTEATVGCVVHEFNPLTDTGPVVPIGQPIANTTLTIANGELIIAGVPVATGYLGQKRFNESYATGDLVETHGDHLVYQGRRDRQLKVNGIRIETSEIEATLLNYPNITAAAVGLNSNCQLIAYYQSNRSIDLTAYLEAKLPRALVPVRVERRESFPISANGKVDFEQELIELNESSLTEDEVLVRTHVAEILKRPVTTIPLKELTGLDSLGLVLLLDKLDRQEMYGRAYQFAHMPTVERIASTLTSLKTNSEI